MAKLISFSVELSGLSKYIKYVKYLLYIWSTQEPREGEGWGFRFLSYELEVFPIEVVPLRLSGSLFSNSRMLIFCNCDLISLLQAIPVPEGDPGKAEPLQCLRTDNWSVKKPEECYNMKGLEAVSPVQGLIVKLWQWFPFGVCEINFITS